MTGKMLVIAYFNLFKSTKDFKYNDNNIDKCYNKNRKIK